MSALDDWATRSFLNNMMHTSLTEKLGDLADIRSGYLFNGPRSEDFSGDVAAVEVKDLKVGQPIDWQKCTHVVEARTMNEARIRRGLVIFSAKGPRDFAWHIDDQSEFAIANSLFRVIDVHA